MKKIITSAFFAAIALFSSCQIRNDDYTEEKIDLTSLTGDENYKSPVALPETENQSEGLSENWWRNSVFYHIWIKSFRDSDGGDCSKNCGDFKGIEESLSYIQDDLGCDAIWLSPFWECAYKGSTNEESAKINMHGYDVSDFYKVNAFFGSGNATAESAEEELVSLIKACHERGMKIIFDFVPNHTSSSNGWFVDSANGENGKSGWYVWSKTALDWKNTWGASAWHKKNGKYYYAAFADTQPDLNYRNREVREEMKNVVRYWLNKGFDGLRIDAARYLVETEKSREDTDETHEWFKELRSVIDEYESPKFMVSEAWIEGNRTKLDGYFGSGDEFNMVFDFDQGKAVLREIANQAAGDSPKIFGNPDESKSYGTFLGNHDEYAGRLGDSETTIGKTGIILATSLSLLRPTVPFIYYGNEIAQKSGTQDGDFRLRQPFDWTKAETQKSGSDSVLSINKTLIALRKSAEYKDVFANGKISVLESENSGALAYTISDGSTELLVVANLARKSAAELSFSGFDVSERGGYSLIVGNGDENADIENDSGCAVLRNFSPHEIRVYDFSSAGRENVLDIWDYDAEPTMYLRGTMNGWDATKMDYDGSEFSASAYLTAELAYEFKFDEFGDWSHSFGTSGSSGTVNLNEPFTADDATGVGTNFSFTPEESGTYVFAFNAATKTAEIRR